jgi:hypothetical protein
MESATMYLNPFFLLAARYSSTSIHCEMGLVKRFHDQQRVKKRGENTQEQYKGGT